MSQSKTWWGQSLLDELESFTDSGRLSRGRAYAKDHRIKKWQIKNGIISATIRGNINPYFGVYKEPTYNTVVKMSHLSAKTWQQIIQQLTQKASFIAKLLIDEIPETIEQVFSQFNSHLLPQNYQDFNISCSCPDYSVPCKHIAGVCYKLAEILDNEPLILFEMRGISTKKLHQELIKSPLGKVLAQAQSEKIDIHPVKSYFTSPKPKQIKRKILVKDFWHAEKIIPTQLPQQKRAIIPAIIIKKGGDNPRFWQQKSSFIETMEDFYLRMQKNNLKKI